MKYKILLSIYLCSYAMIIAMTIAAFTVFRPFEYIDNARSRMYCQNGQYFDTGTNFIYTWNGSLDSFNDIKARKLCQYSIIRDYINSYETPASVNYYLNLTTTRESSWLEAIFVAATVFIVGSVVIESILGRNIKKTDRVGNEILTTIRFLIST